MCLDKLRELEDRRDCLESELKDRINKSYNIQYEDDNPITYAILREIDEVERLINENK